MTRSYDDFLTSKALVDIPTGMEIEESVLPTVLFDWQRALVRWALRRGRAGLFASTGLGKTLMQCAWAEHIPGDVLIFAPLAVTQQTIHEAQEKMGLAIQYLKHPHERRTRIAITNYDRLEHFIGSQVTGIVLDESSCLKGITSKRRAVLFQHFTAIPYRLCATATPAPNDIAEIAMHAEFLGVMSRSAMLATFFVHDDTGWRLRGHARDAFYRWLASWSMALRSPEDLGYDGTAFVLPPLVIKEHSVTWEGAKLLADPDGQLGLIGSRTLHGIQDRAAVRQATSALRVAYAATLARQMSGQLLIWVGLNTESSQMAAALQGEDVREVTGSDTPEYKEACLLGFARGEFRILVTKAAIAGWGMNFQQASTAIFVGLNDSQEMYYQAVRRIWRYGQQHQVTIHVIMSDHEQPIWTNVQRKEQEAQHMINGLIGSIKVYEQAALQESGTTDNAAATPMHVPGWLTSWHTEGVCP